METLPELLRRFDFRGSSVAWIREAWQLLSPLPGGKRLYGRFLGVAIPYTGTIHPEVIELAPGRAVIAMRDRPRLRNHVGSLHAIALCNLAELTGNAALAASLQPDARFIVRGLRMEYLKKARGRIVASCDCPTSVGPTRAEYELEVSLKDESGAEVARGHFTSVVGPVPLAAAP